MPFFNWHYERRDIPQVIGIELDELMAVTTELLDYMRGRRDDLVIYADFSDGSRREFFTDHTELIHMVDVLELYNMGFMIRNVSFWLLIFLFLAMLLLKYPALEVLARCCREVITGFLILTALLVIIIAIDFGRAFEVFHLMFFNNDYWVLNPAQSLLLNMVPQIFFVEISIFVGSLFLAFSAAIIIASTLYLRAIGAGKRKEVFAKVQG
jgi:integral membrane protein (TIGR01906 family)